MSVFGLCSAAVLSLLVILEAVTGAAFFLRRNPWYGGLRGVNPELFVYREENAFAFWVVIGMHSVVIALTLWWFWD